MHSNFDQGFKLLRTALQIMFLAYRPLRLRNFKDLRLHVEVLEVDGRWKLDVPAAATKRGNEYDPLLPERVVAMMLRYRELLSTALGPAYVDGGPLWLTCDGRRMTARMIYYYVTKETKNRFGRSMSPHLFRDAVVTTVSTYMPESVMIGMPLIGNRDPNCLEDHYDQAQRHIADQKYNAVLDTFEDGL